MSIRCAHCGADVSHFVRGPSAHCPQCRGWSLVADGGSTALDIAKLPVRMDKASMLEALRVRTVQAGFGAPQILETNTVWIPHLAREGRFSAVGWELGGRSERRIEGLIGVALGEERGLPIEEIDPRLLEAAPEWSSEVPEVSLDSFDLLVRERVTARMHRDARERGYVLADVNVHAIWTQRVHLVYVPIFSVTFVVQPHVGSAQTLHPSPTGRYQALIGIHDGGIRSIELPRVENHVALHEEIGAQLGFVRPVEPGFVPVAAQPFARPVANVAPPAPAALQSRALSCSACGAPLDLARSEGDVLPCPACGTGASLAERGVQRIRSFELASASNEAAEQAVRNAVANYGLKITKIESRPVTHRFLGRTAAMQAMVYGSVVVANPYAGNGMGMGMGMGGVEREVRSTTRDFVGPIAVSTGEEAPVRWLPVPNVDALSPRGDALVADIDLTLRNFDEMVRAVIGQDMERLGQSEGWTVGYVDVTGQTHGELLELWVRFVWVRFQLSPPGVGRIWDRPSDGGWFSLLYTPDGTIQGRVPGKIGKLDLLYALPGALLVIVVVLAFLAFLLPFLLSLFR